MTDLTCDPAAEPAEKSPAGKSKKIPQPKDRPKPAGDIATDVYAAAAECLDAVVSGRASVNSAIFSSPFPEKRFLLAMTQKTLDHLKPLKQIIYNSKVLLEEPRLTKNMAYVIAFDMLFGEMREARGVARMMFKFSARLKESLAKYLADNNVKDITQLKPETPKSAIYPRYVRVNTLKATTEEVIKVLEAERFKLEEYEAGEISQKTFLKKLRSFRPTTFFRDYHVPDMLVFHPTVMFHGHHLEKSGKVVLQDKASCLPSLLLNPPPGSTVIDACAAPGMKTSHLAALMENDGKIFAVDIHPERCKTMEGLLKHFGTTCTEAVNLDFVQISADDERYSEATHILVDPTCSGSGVTNKLRNSKKKNRKTAEADKQRLQKLKGLQATLLKHAMSFPKVERIVYSTCSLNMEEDEEVVQEAIKAFASTFVVRPYSKVLPRWKGSGKPRYAVGPNCLRSFPEKHRTNGFFVAVIERFTSADAEAAQNGSAEAPEDALAANLTEDVEKEKPTPSANGEKPSSGSKKKRKRKGEVATEHWSAGPGFQAEESAGGSAGKKKRNN
ncbi:putative 28S rRNA (cytosine-C(5))-methyltransferase [Hypsibius exemplaris]|uniref:28S rRNA (Cytosine-C(5))-methyltransferase n=1 Tax=Hypsibius exemplaris TaxID=2072580 RepID=A0A1W0WSU5_HYPEX|nr:putative 28S rRNA (cytosine-C(5))-methyltransferase [Hypsibius exemplaris]